MLFGLKLQVVSNPRISHYSFVVGNNNTKPRRHQPCHLSLSTTRPLNLVVSVHSDHVHEAAAAASSSSSSSSSSSRPPISSNYTASVGSPSMSSSLLQLSQWTYLTPRHIVCLNVLACAAAVSATWLFCSAIPTLLAFKRAAQSLEKLMDVVREELPDTMAAVRLSGMEISDLTMELSDLGQEITQGVRSSTRAVRVAEERLRRLTNMVPSASVQEVVSLKAEVPGPVLARTVRGIREGIVKSRALWQMFFTLTRFSRLALNYLTNRNKR